MKIAATDETIAQVIGRAFFRIPRFQRPYSWGSQEVNEWLVDTLGAEGSYFVGSMVCYPAAGTLQIVDGQQRLTTVMLFLAALRDQFLSIGEENLAKGAQGFVERQDRDFVNRFVLETTSSRPFLQMALQAFPPSRQEEEVPTASTTEEHLLQNAYTACVERLQQAMNQGVSSKMTAQRKRKHQADTLKKLRDRILNLSLIYIELDNEDDAYTVFETLNFRGKDLTASDLVRSHVMKLIPASNATIDSARDRWGKIEQQLSDSQIKLDLGEFLYTSWLSRHGTSSKKTLYRVVKEHVRSEAGARAYLNSLEHDVKLYRGLIEPSSISWAAAARPMKYSLRAIQQLEVNQHLPLLLTAIRASRQRNKITHQKVTRLVDAFESFYYLSTAMVGVRPHGGFGSWVASAAKELEQADSRQERAELIDKAIKRLKSEVPDPAFIQTACLEMRYTKEFSSQKLVIRHILERLHKEADKADATDYEKMSIEHIAPQSSIGDKLKWLDVGSIGNLLLVPKRVNEKKIAKQDVFGEARDSCAIHDRERPTTCSHYLGFDAIRNRAAWMAHQVAFQFYRFRH